MIDSIENKKIHRCNGELALHVMDLIELTMTSAIEIKELQLRTTCKRPDPFTEDEINNL